MQRPITRQGIGRGGEEFGLHLALEALRTDNGGKKDVLRQG